MAGTIRGTAVTISNTEKTRRGGGNRHHADDQRRGGERDDDHGDDGLDHSPGYSWGIAWALPQQCTRTRTKTKCNRRPAGERGKSLISEEAYAITGEVRRHGGDQRHRGERHDNHSDDTWRHQCGQHAVDLCAPSRTQFLARIWSMVS
jgi:hypothetical protein